MRRIAFPLCTLFVLGLLAAVVPSTEAAEPVGAESACNACHTQANLTLNLPGGERLPLRVDPSELAGSVHAMMQCTDCHRALTSFPHPPSGAATIQEYKLSQEVVCQTWHTRQLADMQASIHRGAQEPDRATCTDCHSAHAVKPVSSASFRLDSVNSCSNCHGNQKIMGKYGVSTAVIKTYLQDFHGKTGTLIGRQGRDMKVDKAVCADCHGAHNVRSVEALEPEAMKVNLVGMCAKCHEGATQNFPSAWLSHYEPSLDKAPLVFLVRSFYWIMIPFTIIGLLVHILLDAKNRSPAGRRPR